MTIIRESGNPLLITTLRNTVVNWFFPANLKRQDTSLLNISDPFLAETVEYWSTLNYSEKDNLNFPSSQIWQNSLIRIDNKPFF